MKNEPVEIKIDPNLRSNYKLAGKKVAIIKANFNNEITDEMLDNAKFILEEANLEYQVFEVKGCFEIIFGLGKILERKEFDGIVPLGCLIKGETNHYEYIAENVSASIRELTIKYSKPIGFGILTCITTEQAKSRTSLGAEATMAVLDNICTFS